MARLILIAALLSAVVSKAESLWGDEYFRTGCNYWASHAGMMMWRNWNGEQVEKDLDALAGHGVEILRVFPLWPDFQPITVRSGNRGRFVEWAQNDGPFSNPEGVDEEMLLRFRFLCAQGIRRLYRCPLRGAFLSRSRRSIRRRASDNLRMGFGIRSPNANLAHPKNAERLLCIFYVNYYFRFMLNFRYIFIPFYNLNTVCFA